VFEQSILIDNRLNKSWSFLASVSVELVAVSAMILIPLIYADHLPVFHWRSITVGPPVHPIKRQPVVRNVASTAAPPIFRDPPVIWNPTHLDRANRSAAAGPVALDQPPGIEISSTDGFGPGPVLFEKPINIKPPTPAPQPPKPTSEPIRVSSGVQMAKLVKQVIPIYPPFAKATHTSGVVHLVGIIAKDGTIRNLQLIDGHPLLARAAMEAVAQWIYKPTLLSGEPVEVICPIDVNFTLSQ
jgi:periplasmic protein TonB